MNTPEFKIRGHHLDHFALLVSEEYTPDMLAESIAISVTDIAASNPNEQWYAEDVLGVSASERAKAIRDLGAVFKDFVELQSSKSIIITTGETDGICKSCILGQHCHNRGEEFVLETENGKRGIYSKDFGDMHNLAKFLRLGRSLRENSQISQEFDEPVSCPEFSVEPSPAAIPIETNRIRYEDPVIVQAGYLRAVLEHWVPVELPTIAPFND